MTLFPYRIGLILTHNEAQVDIALCNADVSIPYRSDFNEYDKIALLLEKRFPYRIGLILTILCDSTRIMFLRFEFPYRIGLILTIIERKIEELRTKLNGFPYRIGLILTESVHICKIGKIRSFHTVSVLF